MGEVTVKLGELGELVESIELIAGSDICAVGRFASCLDDNGICATGLNFGAWLIGGVVATLRDGINC